MKKALLSLFVVVATSCGKKDISLPKPPTPGGTVYTVSAFAVADGLSINGTVTPITTQVVSGGSASLNFTPLNGFHTDSIWIGDAKAVALDGINTFLIQKVSENLTVNVSFTDRLTQKQLDSIMKLIPGKWKTVMIESKPSGSVFTTWDLYTSLSTCAKDDYELYGGSPDFTYEDHQNGTICPGGSPNEIKDSGNWQLSKDGKILTLTRPDKTTAQLDLVSVSLDSMITVFHDPGHMDYRYTTARLK